MVVFVVFEFIDIIKVIVVRAVVRDRSEYCANIWVIFVFLCFFLTHPYLFATSWSVVVPK